MNRFFRQAYPNCRVQLMIDLSCERALPVPSPVLPSWRFEVSKSLRVCVVSGADSDELAESGLRDTKLPLRVQRYEPGYFHSSGREGWYLFPPAYF